jgi:predicted SprT family Zn-dependent metalloprotease
MKTEQSTPTLETYTELQRAYDHYNRALFGHSLPPCLITLHRDNHRVYGHFCHKRFVRLSDGRTATDEIALNPMHFSGRPVEEVLSTLAHEMTHLWQAHNSKPSRSAYHNRQWAEKMVTIGLQPSDTGAPGGKTTGQHVTHYVIQRGLFERATTTLLQAGFSLSWADATVSAPKSKKSGKRVKYTCPACGVSAWGKGGLNLVCGNCEKPLVGMEPDGEEAN